MMEEQFTEFNLVLMHMEAVSQIAMKSNQSRVLKLLHVKNLLLKQRPVKAQEDNPPTPQHQPSTSTTHVEPAAAVGVPKIKGKKRRKGEIPMEPLPEIIPVPVAMEETVAKEENL